MKGEIRSQQVDFTRKYSGAYKISNNLKNM